MSESQSSSGPPGSGAVPPVAGTAPTAPPGSGVVPPVAGTAPTAIEGTHAAVGASQSASGGEADPEESVVDYTPNEREAEVLRILRWPPNAYYKVLDVDEDASESTIRQAWRKGSAMAHPDRNRRGPDSTEAMKSKWCF